ncbi:MAG: DUF1573 domain-containing protein [Thermoguttaceae bacterium]|nr:DUF1573 domain-containing protein [Thermoguttaceae bacterium]MDW8039190.1 DUF1573 domain-containing protein [Thermoguttaceae bacterium]
MSGLRVIGWGLAAIGVGLAVGVGWAYYRVWSAYDPMVLIHGAKSPSELPVEGQALPKLVVENTEHNFGVLDADVTRRHAFVFRNEGEGPLTLTAGTTTCRCTLLDLRQTEIPPGSSTEVVIEWNTKNQSGPYRQTATVYTNDPKHPEVILTILGEVRAALKVSPPELVFRNIRVGESISGEAKIVSYITQNFQIISHQWEATSNGTNLPQFDVSITPLSEEQLKEPSPASEASSSGSQVQPRSGVLVQIRSKPFSNMGSFFQKLVLKTNQPQNPQVEIPVEVTVVSDISIFGPGWNEKTGILSFLPIRRGQQAERKLNLTCRGPLSKEVRYQIVSVEPKFLQVELGTPNVLRDGQASLTPIVVRIPPNVEPVSYLGGDHYPLGQILISSTHPQVPQLEIKVRFAVEP